MITKIKNKLYNNEEQIEYILRTIGCTHIKIYKNSFKFGHDEGSSGNANMLNIETLAYHSFSLNVSGDIITLTSEMLGLSIGEAIKWLARELKIKYEYIEKNIKLPFGGFFKHISKVKDNDENPSITYPMNRNIKYSSLGVSKMFIDDGISALTQEEFLLGYSVLDNRITIPWFNTMGELVGIIGRLNKNEMTFEEEKFKYFPIIPFSKGKNLYGLYQNYKYILEEGSIIICESEKSVLKARDMGYYNVVSLGCKNITDIQANLIKSLNCNVILALDKGVPIEESIKQLEKVKIRNPFFCNETYIVDMEHELVVGEKVAIFDLSKNIVDEVLMNGLIYID